MLRQSAAVYQSKIESKIQACRKENIKDSSNIFASLNLRK
jgi:hypothetical protein